MKKQILIFGAAIAIASTVQAQDLTQKQVPSVIVNEFNSQFPKVTDVEWEMDGSLYNVEFEMNWDIDHEVWYNAEGKIIKHKEDIGVNELPKAVKNKLKADFKDHTIDDLERITDNGKVAYKMELNATTQTDWDIVIDAKGNILNKMAD